MSEPLTPDEQQALRAAHYEIEWHLCGDDGLPDLDQPLGPFCAACTDDEWVSTVENGEMIDSAADVVSWPCAVVRLLDMIGATS